LASGVRGGFVPSVIPWTRALPPAATRPWIVVPPVLAVNVPPTKTSNCPGTPGAAQSAAIARAGNAINTASTQTTTQRGMTATLRGRRVSDRHPSRVNGRRARARQLPR